MTENTGKELSFIDLKLIKPILSAIISKGYFNPTPIQAAAIPEILQQKDLLGCAQTGTGKTAAFAIPILQLMEEKSQLKSKQTIKTLVLTPTRELAIQIEENFREFGQNLPLSTVVVYGGVPQGPQVKAIRAGVDVLIATPGRLLDLIEQRVIKLNDIKFFVLDEADRMLDMGFVHDVKKVVALLPKKRQSLFFSATMPPAIQKLAGTILIDPVSVTVTPVSSTAETVTQEIYLVDRNEKKKLLLHILEEKRGQKTLVFVRTKHGADRLVKDLSKGGLTADAIHGDKSQNARQRALNSFKDGHVNILIATDIAARGIDIESLPLVINYEVPEVAENYVHRIGRTGRAGAFGCAMTFVDDDEKGSLVDIQKLIGFSIPVVKFHPFLAKSQKEKKEVVQFRAPKGRDVVIPKNAVITNKPNNKKKKPVHKKKKDNF